MSPFKKQSVTDTFPKEDLDKIEMSLDDIIKSNRNQKRKSNANNHQSRSGSSDGKESQGRGGRRAPTSARKVVDGVLKDRRSGGIQKAKFSSGGVNRAGKQKCAGPKRDNFKMSGSAKYFMSNLKNDKSVFKGSDATGTWKPKTDRGNGKSTWKDNKFNGSKRDSSKKSDSAKPLMSTLQNDGGVLRGAVRKTKLVRDNGDNAWKHGKYNGHKRHISKKSESGKLLFSNLHFGVSDSDMRDLLIDVGPLKKATVQYDRSGRSLGTADVVFQRRSDALKALKQYNGVTLDGRPMKIKFLGEAGNLTKPVRSDASKQQNRRSKVSGDRRKGGAGERYNRGRPAKHDRAGRSPNGHNKQKPALTAEQLDAELDAYLNEINYENVYFFNTQKNMVNSTEFLVEVEPTNKDTVNSMKKSEFLASNSKNLHKCAVSIKQASDMSGKFV